VQLLICSVFLLLSVRTADETMTFAYILCVCSHTDHVVSNDISSGFHMISFITVDFWVSGLHEQYFNLS